MRQCLGNEKGGLTGANFPPNGSTWFGITRRFVSNLAQDAAMPGGIGNIASSAKNSFAVVTSAPTGTEAAIRGLAATETELYVSNTYANQIAAARCHQHAAIASRLFVHIRDYFVLPQVERVEFHRLRHFE
jgi:hypothetical protein